MAVKADFTGEALEGIRSSLQHIVDRRNEAKKAQQEKDKRENETPAERAARHAKEDAEGKQA